MDPRSEEETDETLGLLKDVPIDMVVPTDVGGGVRLINRLLLLSWQGINMEHEDGWCGHTVWCVPSPADILLWAT